MGISSNRYILSERFCHVMNFHDMSPKATMLRGFRTNSFCHICVRSSLPMVFGFVDNTHHTLSLIMYDLDKHIIIFHLSPICRIPSASRACSPAEKWGVTDLPLFSRTAGPAFRRDPANWTQMEFVITPLRVNERTKSSITV